MTRSRRDRRQVGIRVLAASGLAVLLVGGVVAVELALDESDGTSAATPAADTVQRPAPKPRRVLVVRVPLEAVGTYDPEGDGRENDEQAVLAVDRNVATAWTTERYDTFVKQGVGVVFDAGRRRRLRRLDVVSGTPGVTVEVRAGASPDGPFRMASGAKQLAGRTRFPLLGARGRYVVVWITGIPGGGAAEIAEVTLTADR
jgi:hypothetical protein